MTRSRLLSVLRAFLVLSFLVSASSVARADDPEPEVSDVDPTAYDVGMHNRWDRLIGAQLIGSYENGPYGIIGGSLIIQPHRMFRIDLGGGGSRDGARVGGGLSLVLPQDHFALTIRVGLAGGPLSWAADMPEANLRRWDFAAFLNTQIGLEYHFDEGVFVGFAGGVETLISGAANTCVQADGLASGLCAPADAAQPARVYLSLSVGYMFDVTLPWSPPVAAVAEPEPLPPQPGDADGDGLLDDVDQCPNQAEDLDSFEDENGCPDLDNDSDHVADSVDGAPMDPEDADGFEDTDGVPELDNDHDEVVDTADGAPLDPEDRDGFNDADGVPDPDNDGDTVLDPDDQCPLVPGTPEAHGCSPTVQLDVETGTIVILQRVEFDSNGDTILPQSFPILQEVAGVLVANPQITGVRIEGHTDDRGRDPANLDLSRRRAVSVRTWMTQHGVVAERLEAWGCGEVHPIDANTSASGRQANRRVEFHIVSPAPEGGVRAIEGCVQA